MPIETVTNLITKALEVALLVSAPLLLTALVSGVLISLFQAVTQIQEMTLTFIPKILATFVVLIFALPWMIQTLMDYVRNLFDNLPSYLG